MYQALYRKWRPKTFDDVVGQEHITETLKSQVSSGHLSHAYLFIGTRGTGKTTCAKILAKAVNCEHPVNGNPCGECPSCRGIEDGSIMDIVEMDAASNNGVDNIRSLREEAVFTPTYVKKRVYIVDEVHMLSTGAFNALLKILEEPPEHLMFILATTELQKVPATILSRCQRYSFKRISVPQITQRLEYVASQEPFTLDSDAADLIARMADGGMRDALSLLDQCSGNEHITVDSVYSSLGLAGKQAIAQMLDHIIRQDVSSAIDLFHTIWQDGKDPASLLDELSTLMRDLMIYKIAPKNGADLMTGGYDKETMDKFAGVLTTGQLSSQLSRIQEALGSMKTSSNARLAAELCLITLCEPELNQGMGALEERISLLEKKLSGAPVAAATAVKQAPSVPVPSPAPDPAPAVSPAPKQEPVIQQMPDGSPIPEEPPMTDDLPAPMTEEPEPVRIPEPEAEAPAVTGDPNSPGGSISTEDGNFIPTLIERVRPLLSAGVKHMLDSPAVTFRLAADILNLYISSPFEYDVLSKTENVSIFRQEAYKLTGREINVMVHDQPYVDTSNVKKDLSDLTKFQEVYFTGGNNNG